MENLLVSLVPRFVPISNTRTFSSNFGKLKDYLWKKIRGVKVKKRKKEVTLCKLTEFYQVFIASSLPRVQLALSVVNNRDIYLRHAGLCLSPLSHYLNVSFGNT